MQAVYPEHNWQHSKFQMTPTRYWTDLSNQKIFFDQLGVQLGVKTLNDWHYVVHHQVLERGSCSFSFSLILFFFFMIHGLTTTGGATVLQYHDGSVIKAL